MGELPPTGGAAFIAAAGGVAHTRGGGRRHLACGHSGGGGSFVWHQRQGSGAASQPLSHKVSEGELGGGRRCTSFANSLWKFDNGPFWLTAQQAH